MATQMDITGIVAAVVAIVTIGAAITTTMRRDKFEQDRINRLDEEQASLNRINMIRQNYLLAQQRESLPQHVVYIQSPQRQIDVNWIDTNNRSIGSSTLGSYGYGYGNNRDVTFGHNDQIIREIAQRPPTQSPIFGRWKL
jgi:hypothetical protein